ncbi:hypothetical protein ACFL1X_02820 [Candidatus Hydrogenedentota bacterium]
MKILASILLTACLIGCTSAPKGELKIMSKPKVRILSGESTSVTLEAPWSDLEEYEYRYPETIQSNLGLLYLDAATGLAKSDMITKRKGDPVWKTDEKTGAVSYRAELENGVVFGGSVTPEDGGTVACELFLENGSSVDLGNLITQLCLKFDKAPEFADPELERTFVHSGGKLIRVNECRPHPSTQAPPPWPVYAVEGREPLVPGKHRWYVPAEVCDASFISTEAFDGGRHVAIAWENTWKVMSNTQGPCTHTDPVFPPCPSGETVRVRGRVYFFEGSLEDLYKRCEADFGDKWRENLSLP